MTVYEVAYLLVLFASPWSSGSRSSTKKSNMGVI